MVCHPMFGFYHLEDCDKHLDNMEAINKWLHNVEEPNARDSVLLFIRERNRFKKRNAQSEPDLPFKIPRKSSLGNVKSKGQKKSEVYSLRLNRIKRSPSALPRKPHFLVGLSIKIRTGSSEEKFRDLIGMQR